MVDNLPSNEGDAAQSLGWERFLGVGNGNSLHIIAWKIPWTEESGELQSMGLQRDMTEQLIGWLILSIRQNTVFGFVGFVFNYWTNGSPLQCPRLENSMDRGAWWAAVHGVTRVGHDWATSLSHFTFMLWRRKQQPTPVFLPGESQGQGSLVGCHLWGRTESGTTEVT